MGLLRRLARGILRAISTYNPAPLDRPTDYDLGRGTLYVKNLAGEWEPVGKCTSFRLTLDKDLKP